MNYARESIFECLLIITPRKEKVNEGNEIFHGEGCGAPIEFFFEEEDTPNRPLFLTDRERCPKKPFPNPNKIGELTPDEKKLIALLRTSQTVSASETANWVIAQRESRNDR